MLNQPTPENPDVMLPWGVSILDNKHNVRVLCDLAELSFQAKQLITACVQIESNFQSYYIEDPSNPKTQWGQPVKHQNMIAQNTDKKDAKGNPIYEEVVGSTDWGIVQINDYWNIGPGKPFSSTQQVLGNPTACVNFMIQMYKAGQIRLWDSYINLMAGSYSKIAAQYGIVVEIKNISKKTI